MMMMSVIVYIETYGDKELRIEDVNVKGEQKKRFYFEINTSNGNNMTKML